MSYMVSYFFLIQLQALVLSWGRQDVHMETPPDVHEALINPKRLAKCDLEEKTWGFCGPK